MKYIGAHVSSAGGVFNAPLNAEKIGAKAFALFTKNQRQWNAKPLEENDVKKFKENLENSGISPDHILPHDSYLINLGNPDPEKREKSLNAFIDELERADMLGLKLLNFHPGSHLKEISEEECIELIAESMNKAIEETENVVLVIENTAGQGSNMGYSFEHIGEIIKRIKDKSRVGVCLDTCHMFGAGYDFTTEDKFREVFDSFEKLIGFKYLRGMHINDSKQPLGSRKDRHDSIGRGLMGIKPFELIMKDERFDNIPLVLETVDPEIWEEEIKLLYSFMD